MNDTVTPWAEVPSRCIVDGVEVPFTVDAKCVLDNGERYAHCDAARREAQANGYRILVGPGNREIDAPCVLVGSGPSAIPLLPEIKARYDRGEEIIAIKGAHDWLIDNGVMPTAAIAMDPQHARAKCFKRLRREALYLCASQMHPATWAHLKGQRVLVWHSRIELAQEKRPGWESAYLVPSCTTTGNSAIVLLYLMGRRNLALYGFDSSLPPDFGNDAPLLKLDGTRVKGDEPLYEVAVGHRVFMTTAPMAMQAQEMPLLLKQLPGVRVEAHGRGYYQALLAEGKARGWPV